MRRLANVAACTLPPILVLLDSTRHQVSLERGCSTETVKRLQLWMRQTYTRLFARQYLSDGRLKVQLSVLEATCPPSSNAAQSRL